MTGRIRTFLFTDLEGSTRRWNDHEQEMAAALARHDDILRIVVEEHTGQILKHTGDGVVAVFADTLAAVEAAIAAQRALRADPDGAELLRTRMGLHVGPCRERGGDFFGPTLNRAARIMGVAHGGQVLASSSVAAVLGNAIAIADLGLHRLRDLLEPEHLHQVVVDDAGAYPPVRSLDVFDHNLPTQRSSLIGRDDDVREVRKLLESTPLVTLTGVGGVGKTRLALEVAARELDQRAGAVFVDLASVADAAQVPQAAATALGLASTEDDRVEDVRRVLSSRSMVVVLDNCEHLLDACADLVESLLGACPPSAIVVTSREPLGVDGERVWRVPSLTSRESAVELFCDRALAVRPGFVVDAFTEDRIARICSQLDGIPLAIELAAARVAHLSVGDIESLLDERFRLLSGGRRRGRPRHQTLQAALDWSHDLLSAAEATALRRCGVFLGGFSLAAFESVVPGDDLASLQPLDLLASLVDKSLVAALPDTGGAGRYALLETVRLYALDRLAAADETSALRDRHLAWIHEHLADVNPFSGFRRPDVLLEHDNVLAALDWAEASCDLATVGRLAVDAALALGGVTWVDDSWRFLGRDDVAGALDDEDRCRYLATSSMNANNLGDFARQTAFAEEARTGAPGTPMWRAASLLLANALSITEPARSETLYAEVIPTIPSESRDELNWAIARSADPLFMTGRVSEAAARLDDAATLSGVCDPDRGVAKLLRRPRGRSPGRGRLARAGWLLPGAPAGGDAGGGRRRR